MTAGAVTDKPVEPFPALRATSCSFLLCHPSLDAVLLHVLQILDHMGVVRDTSDNVSVGKVPEPLTRKLIALKTPGRFLLRGALTKAAPALHTEGEYRFRQTTIAVVLST